MTRWSLNEQVGSSHDFKFGKPLGWGHYPGQVMNHLYYGDNLQILREHIKDESVDLVYLDPPFNSQGNYNILFKSPIDSEAQIEAFDDTWHWNDSAEEAFDAVMKGSNGSTAEMLRALRCSLKENDMMAYLTMMAVRLLNCIGS